MTDYTDETLARNLAEALVWVNDIRQSKLDLPPLAAFAPATPGCLNRCLVAVALSDEERDIRSGVGRCRFTVYQNNGTVIISQPLPSVVRQVVVDFDAGLYPELVLREDGDD